ncbi:unnamed protein product [Alopecurus aequalis]
MDGPKGPSEGRAAEEAGDGVQAVARAEKNKLPTAQDGAASGSGAISAPGSSRAMTAYDKSPGAKASVPFHDPTIPRPQEVYRIRVDNSTLPFNHVWLERSEDGTPIHPLEKLHVEQFIDRSVAGIEPARPADVEDTPFTLVEDKKGLTELANKLKDVNEFAVDLEHNQYRSFQGLTCLMQISTRTEDFIIDTLKLHVYIGPYLREHFKDPTKRKVMHGADRDIMWLQRDFRVYVCNLFDTGQASRVLKMERNSLEHLLRHFCAVTADKMYQSADWRLRPLSDEMIKYAREDTHYLLYIYDLMRLRLQRESQRENDLLLEVQKRSNVICLQLYEKELLTDESYLNIYRLNDHELEANQLAVVSALHQWRDYIAREKDESTGYVLPNKALIEIAKKMPATTADLRRIVKSKYPFDEDNFDQILNVVRNATANSNASETITEQLKKSCLGQLDSKSILDTGEAIEMAPLDADNDRISFDPADHYSVAPSSTANISVTSNSRDSPVSDAALTGSMWLHDNTRTIPWLHDNTRTIPWSETKTSWALSGLNRPFNKEVMSNNKQETHAAVQEVKSPMPFGAPEGNTTSGMQTNYYGRYSNEQAQGNAYNYPQVPDYSNLTGWSSHHVPEGIRIQPSGYDQYGCYHGYQPAVNQSSTGSGNPTSGMQTGYFGGFSNEQAQGNAYNYPQVPDYSNLAGSSSHHGPEVIQRSGYDQHGCYHGHQPAVNQSSTGSGQPAAAAARNNGGGYYGYYGYQPAVDQSSTGSGQPAAAAARNNGGGYYVYYGYQPAVNQSSTGSGQPAAAAPRNNGGGYQDPRKQQFFPPSG